MGIIHTIILGVVEGITEFLPISSTAHLEIAQYFLGITTSEFTKTFEIVIQSGAILAVVLLYFKKIFRSWIYFRNICIAFIPTGFIGFILYKLIKHLLLGNLVIAISAMLTGGIIIVVFEWRAKKNSSLQNTSDLTIESMPIKDLLLLGCAQSLAVIPGVSRSGAVIIAGRILKLPAAIITEFSFILAIPTMLAATLYDLLKSGFSMNNNEWGTILVGFVVSFVVALFVVKWLIAYVRSHSFAIFGWYRIVIGLILLFVFL